MIMPIAAEFDPDFVFVSAGFDAAVGDPIGGCLVSPEGFAHMTHMLKGLAGGKLMLALEGGYSIKAVADSSEACMKILRGRDVPRLIRPQPPSQSCLATIERVVAVQSQYWKSLVPRTHRLKDTVSVSIQDLASAYWSQVCTLKFGLLNLPILDERFIQHFENRVHVSDDILNCSNGIVLVAHEVDPIVQDSDYIESNIISVGNTKYIPSYKSLIERLQIKGVGIIDVYVPARSWKLRQTSAGPAEDLSAYNEFFLYLWDTFLQASTAKSLFIITSGLPNYAIGKLVDSRPVEDLLKGIALFSSTLFLPIVAPEKGTWYQEHSKVYLPGSDKPLGAHIPTANVYGSCYSGGQDSIATPLWLEDQLYDYIVSKL